MRNRLPTGGVRNPQKPSRGTFKVPASDSYMNLQGDVPRTLCRTPACGHSPVTCEALLRAHSHQGSSAQQRGPGRSLILLLQGCFGISQLARPSKHQVQRLFFSTKKNQAEGSCPGFTARQRQSRDQDLGPAPRQHPIQMGHPNSHTGPCCHLQCGRRDPARTHMS